MANYCSNCIQFECSGETLEQIKSLFNEMALKEKEKSCGQLPDFIQADKGFMFDIFWNEDLLFYETRWCPNIEIITAIADHFRAGFTYTYDEMGNLVYGQVVYKYGILTDTYLELPDFEEYSFSEETDKYSFEGKEYENDYEILEILLKRKKQQMEQCKFSMNN